MSSNATSSFAGPDPSAGSALLVQAREGSREALDALFERNRGWVLALIRRRLGPGLRAHVESTDILQVTLLRAFQNVDQFQGASEASFGAWLAGIAHNAIRDEFDYLRRQRRDVLRTVPLGCEAEALAAPVLSGVGQLIAREEAERLRKAVSSLDGLQRDVILLRKYEDLSFREIGARLGKSPDACRMLHTRALRALARKLPWDLRGARRRNPRRLPRLGPALRRVPPRERLSA